MYQMSMKLPAMFDQNPPHTLDQTVAKHIPMKMISNLDLEPKCQGHSKNLKISTWGTKNMPPLKQRSRDFPTNWCASHVSNML